MSQSGILVFIYSDTIYLCNTQEVKYLAVLTVSLFELSTMCQPRPWSHAYWLPSCEGR